MAKATPATAALEKAGIAFTLHEYDYDPNAARIGMQAAEALGIAPERLLKTLMAKAGAAIVCVLAPSDREVSLKRLAAAAGAKDAAMLPPAEAERITGYHVGGISPFGQKKARRSLHRARGALAPDHPREWRTPRLADRNRAGRSRACDRRESGRLVLSRVKLTPFDFALYATVVLTWGLRLDRDPFPGRRGGAGGFGVLALRCSPAPIMLADRRRCAATGCAYGLRDHAHVRAARPVDVLAEFPAVLSRRRDICRPGCLSIVFSLASFINVWLGALCS